MAYEKISSQIPTMKGISVDLPFFRFRYVKVEDDSQQQSTASARYPENRIQLQETGGAQSPELREDLSARAIKVEYTQRAEVTTLGSDPLVSKASVIHELVYGRMESSSAETRTQTSYPVSKEYIAPSLDFTV